MHSFLWIFAPEPKYFYNIYSINEVKQFFEENGYKRFEYTPFEINIDLNKPMDGGMGTYTETLEDGRKLQFGGPILIPEYFICAIKNGSVAKNPKIEAKF